MSSMTVVEEANRDALSRLAGCYLFLDTRLWMEGGVETGTSRDRMTKGPGAQRHPDAEQCGAHQVNLPRSSVDGGSRQPA